MAAPAGQVSFDIPAQPLVSALDAYSTATGREVFYDGALVLGRRSSPVSGMLLPDAALRALLQGTGFAPRATGPHSFTVSLAPQPPVDLSQPPAPAEGSGYEPYFAMLQAVLRQALCRTAETRPGRYQLVVRLWLASSGAVQRSQLLGSTGSRQRDSAFAAALRLVKVNLPPPAGMPQPLTMVVLPRPSDAGEECSALRAASEAN
jgi:hypothetical protein